MELKCFNLEEMAAACARALNHLAAANRELAPYQVILNAEQRQEIVPVPLRLNKAGRVLVQASGEFPRLLGACPKFNGPYVINRLECAEIIAPLAHQAETLAQRANDTYRTWMAEAFTSTLSVYRVGKAMAEDDPALQVVIQPLVDVFDARRARASKKEEPDAPAEAIEPG